MATQPDPKTVLENNFDVRGGTRDDIEGLFTIFNDYWETLTGSVKLTLDDLRNIFSMPGFAPESSTRIVVSPHGQIVGGILVMDLASPPVHPSVYGCVHVDYEGKGIGTFLIQWAEERARQAIDRVPDGARVSMLLQTSSSHEPTKRLFEKLGLGAVRYSWFMLKNLDVPPPEPLWPEGICIQTYQDHPDLKAVMRATDEAFQDHWGHVDREDEESWLKRVQHSLENDADFDPSLWFLAMDGDEIAAVARCSPRLGDDWDIGVVDTLGVRRRWRRQGLGLALLHHAFGEFHRRGHRQVVLGVDTGSLTGATRLYEKAGMHVIREFVVYEKELRPGEELAKQSIQE